MSETEQKKSSSECNENSHETNVEEEETEEELILKKPHIETTNFKFMEGVRMQDNLKEQVLSYWSM